MLPAPDKAYELVDPVLLSRGVRGLGLLATPMWRIDADDAYIGMEVQTDDDGNDIYLPSVVTWRAVAQDGWTLRSKDHMDRHERLKVPHVAIQMKRTMQPAAWWRTSSVDSLESLVYAQDLRDMHSDCGEVHEGGEWTWKCRVYEGDDPDSAECRTSEGFVNVEYLVPAFALTPLTGKGAAMVADAISSDKMSSDIETASATDMALLTGGCCHCVEHYEGMPFAELHLDGCVTDFIHCTCCDLGGVVKSMESLVSGDAHPVSNWSPQMRTAWEALIYKAQKGWGICRSPSNESEMSDFPMWKTNYFFGSSRHQPIRRHA